MLRRLSAGVNGLFTVMYKSMHKKEFKKSETMKSALNPVKLTLSRKTRASYCDYTLPSK